MAAEKSSTDAQPEGPTQAQPLVQSQEVHHDHHHRDHVIPGEIPVPHGPPASDDGDEYMVGASPEERRIFSHVTRPDDSYTPEGVYWADLPLSQRFNFVFKVDKKAAAQELKTIGGMVKKDPLSPVSWYFRHAILPGAGLGLEGYVLFSIGNLEPLFKQAWPECWGTHEVCSKNWVASVQYLEIIGIMFGQVLVGVSFSYSSQLARPFLSCLVHLY